MNKWSLATSRFAHDSNCFSRLCSKWNVLKNWELAIWVLEWYILKLDLSFKSIRLIDSLLGVHNFRLWIIDFHYLSWSSWKSLELIHNVSKLSHRIGNSPDKAWESYIIAHWKRSVYKEKTSHKNQNNRQQVSKSFYIRIELKPDSCCLLVGISVITIALVKLLYLILFSCKRLNYAVTRYIFLGNRIHVGKLFSKKCMHWSNHKLKHIYDHKDKWSYS